MGGIFSFLAVLPQLTKKSIVLANQDNIYKGDLVIGFETVRFEDHEIGEGWWVDWDTIPELPMEQFNLGPKEDTGFRFLVWDIEFVGQVSVPGHYGHLNQYPREVKILELLRVREASPLKEEIAQPVGGADRAR